MKLIEWLKSEVRGTYTTLIVMAKVALLGVALGWGVTTGALIALEMVR